MTKVSIIYWGLIRGFKFDSTYESHNKFIYDYLEQNNIEYDIYIVTNDVEYDDTNIKKLKNVKKLLILNIDKIEDSQQFSSLKKNKFQKNLSQNLVKNLIVCYLNRKEIMKYVNKNSDIYISLDIGHEIENCSFLDSIEDIKNGICLTSSFGKARYINPRIFISNYNNMVIYNNTITYFDKTINCTNPEHLLLDYLKSNNVQIKEVDTIKIHRIRSNGDILRDS